MMLTQDRKERLRMITKLFNLYPLGKDRSPKEAMAAYLEELRDIPVHWISRGLADTTREAGRIFMPSVSEIRTKAAQLIRRHRRVQQGKDPNTPHGRNELHLEREFRWANGTPQLASPTPLRVAGRHA